MNLSEVQAPVKFGHSLFPIKIAETITKFEIKRYKATQQCVAHSSTVFMGSGGTVSGTKHFTSYASLTI